MILFFAYDIIETIVASFSGKKYLTSLSKVADAFCRWSVLTVLKPLVDRCSLFGFKYSVNCLLVFSQSLDSFNFYFFNFYLLHFIICLKPSIKTFIFSNLAVLLRSMIHVLAFGIYVEFWIIFVANGWAM